jgi:alkyl hydroperoxide reductase subunit AhpC
MVRVGCAAPQFSCTAVIGGTPVALRWAEVHANQTLVLLFGSLDEPGLTPEELSELTAALRHPGVRARLAVVCDDPPDTVLTWAIRRGGRDGPGSAACPLIVDDSERIAARYGLRPANGWRLSGHVILDAGGVVEQVTVSRVPVAADGEELVRLVRGCRSLERPGAWN